MPPNHSYYSTVSLHHWQNPKQALQELYRVLRPEGQVLIFDLRRDGRKFFYWLLRFAQTFVVPVALRRISEPIGSALSLRLRQRVAQLCGVPGGIRTHDPLLRRQPLCPTELQGRVIYYSM